MEIPIAQTGIAWSSDVGAKFQNILNVPSGKGTSWEDVQWLDMTDEHFIVWMRTSGLPTFRKLWGRIDDGLLQGEYYVRIVNNYEVMSFSGSKSLVISTMNFLGGKNEFLSYLYIVVGIGCFIASVIFLVLVVRKNRASLNVDN